MTDPKPPQLPPEAYANFLRIALAPSEFHLAFGQLPPGETQAARLVSALVTTPIHAKAMLQALASSIERYEQQFGEIPRTEPGAARPADAPQEASRSAKRPPRSARRRTG